MMTLRDYEFLQRIEREKEDGKARRRIVRRQYTREERKRRNTIRLVVLAVLCTCMAAMALFLDNSGDDPTRVLPLQMSEAVEPAERKPVSNGMEVLGEFALTAYCSCEKCCGKWALDRPLDENGKEIVYTASGEEAETGVTVAVDPDVIPLGTDIYIVDMGWYKAQDTGAFTGNVIDIYHDDHEAACEFGRQDAIVAIREVEANG